MRRFPWALPWLLGLALAQGVALETVGSSTLAATWDQVLTGRGTWAFQAHLRYTAPPGNHKVLVQAVPSGGAGLELKAYLTPGTPVVLSGSGTPGNLLLPGRTLLPSGFLTLVQGASGVTVRLPLTLELEAQGPGPLPPGYLFLQVTVVILPE
ncbi:MAG: hypothetical protein ACK4ZX_09370 [Thermus sp.]